MSVLNLPVPTTVLHAMPDGSIIRKFADSDIQASLDKLTKDITPGHGKALLQVNLKGASIVGVEKFKEHWSVAGSIGFSDGQFTAELDSVISW